ncbi:hypothetical protein [Bacillus sp. FJAT-47783]|uniref:hypothetical protein n=1 Tax=Bacillus sp. FJAT-47783 TaxID=2922712 RepID=UPI001FADB451|nr:hypothetical protein [Bacillus sp. FJAT-47783]
MPKYNKNKKERIEIFLDKEKDAAVIDFLNKHATTRASFIRHVLHEYVKNYDAPSSTKKASIKKAVPKAKNSEAKKKQEPDKPRRKRLTPLGQAFSSKNFEDEKKNNDTLLDYNDVNLDDL